MNCAAGGLYHGGALEVPQLASNFKLPCIVGAKAVELNRLESSGMRVSKSKLEY